MACTCSGADSPKEEEDIYLSQNMNIQNISNINRAGLPENPKVNNAGQPQ